MSSSLRYLVLGYTLISVLGGCSVTKMRDDRPLKSRWTSEQRREMVSSNPACAAVTEVEIHQVLGAGAVLKEAFGPGQNYATCKYLVGEDRWFYFEVQPFPHGVDAPLWCAETVSDYPNPPKHWPHCSVIVHENLYQVGSRAETVSEQSMTALLRLAVKRITVPQPAR